VDPATVAAFYQGKGYTVREGARVAGLSGNEHKVPLLAEGPLGSLAVFFGDFGGVDGPEMGGARKAARDIGATPVLAADSFTNQDRQVAARLGVVLLDGSMLEEDHGPPPPHHPDAMPWPSLQTRGAPGPATASAGGAGSSSLRVEEHPWPASGRAGGRDGPGAAAVDIDDLLAETRRPRQRDPEPAVPDAEDEAPVPAPAPPAAASGDGGEGAEPGTLWKRPRRAPRASSQSPSQSGPRQGRFAWLDAAGAAPSGGDKSRGDGAGGFAVDYDDVVPSRAAPKGPDREDADAGQGDAEGAAGERLGEEPGLRETWEEQQRRERRDRVLRRTFWLLFAFAILSFLWLFWNGKIGN
jgi:hypothetical protein